MPIVIDVKFAGATQAGNAFDRIKKAVTQIKAETKQWADDLDRVATSTAAIASNLRAAGKSSPITRSVRQNTPKTADPYANNPTAGMAAFRAGAAAGDPTAGRQFNKYYTQDQARKRAQKRAQGKQPGSDYIDSLMRTRFKFGPFAMPLGRDMVSMLGMEPEDLHKLMFPRMSGPQPAGTNINKSPLAKASSRYGSRSLSTLSSAVSKAPATSVVSKVLPLILAAAGPLNILSFALTGFIAAAKLANSELNRRTGTAVAGGFTGSRSARIFEDSLGLGPGGAAAIGRGLSEGWGRVAAAKAGINPNGGPYGDINYNKKFVRLIDYMQRNFAHTQKGFEQARRFTEGFAPELAKINLTNPLLVKAAQDKAERSSDFANMRKNADFEQATALVKESFSEIVVAMSAPTLVTAAKTFNQLATAADRVPWDILSTAINPLTQAADLLQSMNGLVNDIVNPLAEVKRIIEWIKTHVPGMGGPNKDEKDHAEAMRDHTKEMKQWREGTFGGGNRARTGPQKLNPGLDPHYRDPHQGML